MKLSILSNPVASQVGTGQLFFLVDSSSVYLEGYMYGPFHRINDAPETVKKILESGELWVLSPRNIGASNFPKVKAYEGKLPADRLGIEFETEVKPDEGTPPGAS